MVILGLYLGGWWQGLAALEHAGGLVWARLEPLGRRFLPVRRPGQAFLMGLVWGWLPCGLVYSVLIWSISTADPLYGAALLLSFGLGTLPNMLAMGVLAERLSARVGDPRVRRFAGLLVIGFGLFALYQLIP
jgi:sulfite exporter TauE/SafE